MIDWLKPMPSLAGVTDDGLRDQHVALQRHIRIVRIVIPVAVLLIITIGVLHMRATVQAVEGAAVASAFEKQANRIYPRLTQAAAEVGEEVAPVVGDAFAKQLDKTFEKLSGRLDVEMTKLGEELPVALETQVQRKLQTANARVAESLYASFPDLRSDPARVERLLASFQSGFSAWAGKTLTTTFARHIKELEAIKATLNGFVSHQNMQAKAERAVAAEAGQHQAHPKITPDQLLALWLEILDEALKGDGGESDLFAAPAEEPAAASKPAK